MKIRVLNSAIKQQRYTYSPKKTFYEDSKFEIVCVDSKGIYVLNFTNTWHGGKDVLPEYIKRQLRKIVL